jgi:hypothetical protein
MSTEVVLVFSTFFTVSSWSYLLLKNDPSKALVALAILTSELSYSYYGGG